ncbi:hypothetical protein [Streptomyces sp. NBC_01314]|uniref:hypothetical protein n=1 Tax=Streptomyces sp. NBC_01314 TaxID=2903821 RepID=UPI00308E9ECE|nr:hypothetical protein OG622_27640 [Streptomyces sp. NBC_01314]
MDMSEEAGAQPRDPDPVRATFHAWLDHVLVCHDCRHTPARHCYGSARLGDQHRRVARAARLRR